jgi:hypothetical protein
LYLLFIWDTKIPFLFLALLYYISPLSATFICGKAVDIVWKTGGNLSGDFHGHNSMRRFIWNLKVTPIYDIYKARK